MAVSNEGLKPWSVMQSIMDIGQWWPMMAGALQGEKGRQATISITQVVIVLGFFWWRLDAFEMETKKIITQQQVSIHRLELEIVKLQEHIRTREAGPHGRSYLTP